MSTTKISVDLDSSLVHQLDEFVKSFAYPSRSLAIRSLLAERLRQLERENLEKECKQLDSQEERLLAEEGLGMDLKEWPEY